MHNLQDILDYLGVNERSAIFAISLYGLFIFRTSTAGNLFSRYNELNKCAAEYRTHIFNSMYLVILAQILL